MNRFQTNTLLRKRWFWGLLIFVLLASACVFIFWPFNEHKPGKPVFTTMFPLLVLWLTSAVIIVYVSCVPNHLQQLAKADIQEKRNRAIVNALPDMVFIIDRQGRYMDFSAPAYYQNLVNPEQFLLKKVSDFLSPSLAAETIGYIEKVLRSGESCIHYYRLEVGDQSRSYESRYVPHGKDDVMVLVRDVTEMKKIEQRLRESESKYRTLVDLATDGIFIANFHGNILVVNPAGCKLLQYTETELLAMRFHDLAVAEELLIMPFKLAEITSGKTITAERKMKRKDGRVVDVEVSAKLIAPNKILSFVRDITERKQAENELLRSREQLRQLTHYMERIHEEERSTISKEIHEELGQQLAVLKMDLSQFGKKLEPADPRLNSHYKQIHGSINNMIETVRKISFRLRPGMLDDIGLIATLAWYCEDFSRQTGTRISFDSDITDDKFPQELGTGLFRICQESLVNAVSDAEATKIEVSVRQQKHQLVLIIEDNGKGFDPSQDRHLKTPGIRFMMERASKINCSYQIDSFPGRGTRVEVSIPLNNRD
ncbi:MAG: PAS domain S-box protein [Bacteroidetes bacterium]|jgi:PAS domain S-box-containing protein|nr:MAG: PAS domain S-box protein [Bacteroidota bacterium]